MLRVWPIYHATNIMCACTPTSVGRDADRSGGASYEIRSRGAGRDRVLPQPKQRNQIDNHLHSEVFLDFFMVAEI